MKEDNYESTLVSELKFDDEVYTKEQADSMVSSYVGSYELSAETEKNAPVPLSACTLLKFVATDDSANKYWYYAISAEQQAPTPVAN